MKPENIIICSHNEGLLIPKLADFGFTIIPSTEAPHVYIGGTSTWRTPGPFSLVSLEMLKYNYIYSFGLLAWSITIDVRDPFSLLLPNDILDEFRYSAFDRLRSNDYVTNGHSATLSSLSEEGKPDLSRSRSTLPESLTPGIASNGTFEPTLAATICDGYRELSYFRALELLFNFTLSKDPTNRDLPSVVRLFKYGHVENLRKGLAANVADPNFRLTGTETGDNTSPSEWTALYNHTERLKLTIEHLGRTSEVLMTTNVERGIRHAVMDEPLVTMSIHTADKFSMIFRNGEHYLDQLKSPLALLQGKTGRIRFSTTRRGPNETLPHCAASGEHDEVYARVLAINPYDETDSAWSALHIFADQAHDDDLTLVDDILDAGVPVDGEEAYSIDTPFNVAVVRNAFNPASLLLTPGALINATSTKSSLIVSSIPLTVLGHIIDECSKLLQRSAIHPLKKRRRRKRQGRLPPVPNGLKYSSEAPISLDEFDEETNRSLTHELLQMVPRLGPTESAVRTWCWYRPPFDREMGRVGVGVVEELVKAGADTGIVCETGETAADIAERDVSSGKKYSISYFLGCSSLIPTSDAYAVRYILTAIVEDRRSLGGSEVKRYRGMVCRAA
ncbi:hypothetical protein NA57DRAFT_51835 [Rhizodiscina lignyota]|uniref:Protein kinase domain-containing protein n=1 Tax=Rhizodiscina lignyota TaxID=1504668 RepID=A0A9P4ITJ1_9PEZI|nr:hypothetical protein NA57DRAFT_51835 [Rhizodiscina lignyota]